MKRVFLASEGRNDLGGYARHKAYRADNTGKVQLGVVEALMRQIQPDGWEIVDALPWRSIPKFQSGNGRSAETRTVLGAAAFARNLRCDTLIIARDRDGYVHRTADVEAGIAQAPTHFPIRVAGGIAIEKLEAWVLAIGGHHKSEGMREPDAKVATLKLDHTDAMTDHIAAHGRTKIPEDAKSLHAWLESVRQVLVE